MHEPLVKPRTVQATMHWRHHFHGRYSAAVHASFDELADANAALRFFKDLPIGEGARIEPLGPKVSDDGKFVVGVFYVPAEEGQTEGALEDLLEEHRVILTKPDGSTWKWCPVCDRKHSIGDTAHSIDWAQPFMIEFEAPYQDAPGQRMLPL